MTTGDRRPAAVLFDLVQGAVDAVAEVVLVLCHPPHLPQEVGRALLGGHIGNLLQQPRDGILLV